MTNPIETPGPSYPCRSKRCTMCGGTGKTCMTHARAWSFCRDPLEQRLATLEQQHKAMASELHSLDQRLAALEPAEQLTGEPVANPAALAQAWERLTQVQREELQRWMMAETPGYLPPYAHRLAAESALVAASGLVAEIVRLRQRVEELAEQRAQLLTAVAHVARQARGIEDPLEHLAEEES